MRLSLIGFGILLLAPLSAAVAAAQSGGFIYAPGTQHYRLVTDVHRAQIQGGGRAPFEFDVKTTQLVTVHITPRARDTLALELTLDSVAVSTEFNAPQPDVKHLFGAKLDGLISPQGKVYSFNPPAGNTDPQIEALYGAFERFLVSFPQKPITVGTSWADTTLEHVNKDGFNVTARAVTLTRVAGDTTVNGQHVWRVVRHSDIVQSGEHSQEGGEPLQLLGQGTVNAVHLLTHDGVYLSSQSMQRIDITMKNSLSETAPIQQTIKSTVERLPNGA
ncbi:MAG TPA: hypothetical protein VIC55_03480 [Gemmatimonadaceae bacterium]